MHEGRAFHESLPGGQQGGQLDVTRLGVNWTGEGGGVMLPLAGLQLEVGGSSNRIVFFRHPGLDGWVITADVAILADPAFSSHPGAAALVTGARRKRALGTGIAAGVLLLIVGGLIALFALRGRLVEVAAEAIPPELEVSLGQAGAEAIASKSKVLEGEDIDAALAALTLPLLEGIGETRWQYRFRVVDDSSVNAFALPGGEVFVHSGLILRAERAEELAGVLAHEIAHVEERHATRALVGRLGLALIAQLIIGDATGLEAVLLGAGPELAGLKFSRDFEREADREGFGYLERAGIDPTGMSSLFRKLEADSAVASIGEMPAAFAILSTHPASKERFEALEALERERGPFTDVKQLDLDFAAFQERIGRPAPLGE